MTKRAAKRESRESYDDGKIRRLPVDRGGWTPLGANDEGRDQGYLKTIKPKSEGQAELLKAIDSRHLTMALGPAGTGKTYLAVAKAVEALEAGKVGRIVLSRPAVEAGESIGFRNVIVRWPKQRLTVVLLSNRNDPTPYATAMEIGALFQEQ